MFPTTRAAAWHTVRQKSGVLLFFGRDDGHDPMCDYYIGGLQVVLGLVDTLRRRTRPVRYPCRDAADRKDYRNHG
ncbi:hypothetical protein [Corynebacterium glyciniphilum]|uniref:hypothetical protein n=1 Tax=Corynebacterium glyciniphilum TaxID=1404244 RepID=UPI003FD11C0E